MHCISTLVIHSWLWLCRFSRASLRLQTLDTTYFAKGQQQSQSSNHFRYCNVLCPTVTLKYFSFFFAPGQRSWIFCLGSDIECTLLAGREATFSVQDSIPFPAFSIAPPPPWSMNCKSQATAYCLSVCIYEGVKNLWLSKLIYVFAKTSITFFKLRTKTLLTDLSPITYTHHATQTFMLCTDQVITVLIM